MRSCNTAMNGRSQLRGAFPEHACTHIRAVDRTVYGPRGGVEGAGRWAPARGVAAGTAAAVLRSGGCLVALLGAVDGGASDTEQVGQFGGAVLTGVQQADQMCFLPGLSLGCLPRSRPLAFAPSSLLGCAAGP